ncbi:DUF4142 domain-containing protein [Aurantimonas sp. VKM B-3413]|uniref:DUF4142 domain-containing protein n=1 Tax=Aurantimonas sp. VKM B-3413 TaxID=2779401 RepID=UPI001E56CC94|nr:DUF4142 domain-containing protein [Aurantimonas sp. VKM B-3413]MCB8838696.1 DUF4142 domain-containing protein [Aurantimonas sp. VKM B-3413]
MKRTLLSLTAALSLAVAAPALAQSSNNGTTGKAVGTSAMQNDAAPKPAPQNVKTAANFVPMAAVSNSFEIESSNLALQKSKSQAVHDFAKTMVNDHSAAGDKLKAAVKQSKMDVAVPNGLDARHKQMLNDLQAAPSDSFDAKYIQMQSKAHDEAVALFTAYSKNGEKGPIREFATKTLPTLKQHKQMVQKLQNNS